MSGVEEYTLQLLRGLFHLDPHNHYILFYNAQRDPGIDLSWIKEFPRVRIVRYYFPNKIFNILLWYFRWPKIDRMMGGVDVFFMPNLNFISLSKQVRLVVTAHDLSFEICPHTFSFKRRLWHALVAPKRLFRRADALISVSGSTSQDLRDVYGIDPLRIRTIQSGVGEEFVQISRNDQRLVEVKKKYRLPYKFIFHLGTLEPRKNVIALARAFEEIRQKHPDYKLVIAGMTGWKSKGILDELRTVSATDAIYFIGKVDEEDKPALYNLATVFVYPSLYEGFGFPVLEAMRCGTPVVTSHLSSMSELAGDAAILIDPYRPSEIARAVNFLLDDEALRVYFSDRGRRMAYKYRWEFAAQETLEIFRKVLGNNKEDSKSKVQM